MDSEEFLTWAAFVTMEPFAEDRADVHTAMLMAQTYNINRGKGKPARKAGDFMPQWTRQERGEQTPSQRVEALKANFLAMGGDPMKLTQ